MALEIGKKINKFSLIVLILLVIFVWYIVKPRSYMNEYIINDVKVIEEFNKDLESYYFTFVMSDFSYVTSVNKKYMLNHKNVLGIEVFETNEEVCLNIKSDTIYFYPVCKKDDNQISFHLVSKKMKDLLGDKYYNDYPKVNLKNDKLEVMATINHNYFIYNYKGFYMVDNSKISEINIFNRDFYESPLLTKVGNILFVPNYEENYFFKKVYLVNMDNGSVSSWDLKDSIYFDSMVLGVKDNCLYLLDKHEKKEWKLDVLKKKMSLVSSSGLVVIYDDGWNNVSLNKIINENISFKSISNFDVFDKLVKKVKDGKIVVSDLSVKRIVYSTFDSVYYLSKDGLYYYSDYYGECLVMKNFEWNFNYDNVIFVN